MIARSPAPGTTVVEGDALLDAATFGLSKFWSDTKTRNAAALKTTTFVKAALKSMGKSAPYLTDGSGPARIEIVLNSEEHGQECAEAIMAARLPDDPELPTFVEPELPFADLS